MIKINLLPDRARKDFLKIDLYLFFFGLLIALTVFGAIYYTNENDIANYKNRIDSTKKRLRVCKIFTKNILQ